MAQIGPLLKTWRTRRRLSQLDLALEAGVSTRHLSFVETGRSRPSEQMVRPPRRAARRAAARTQPDAARRRATRPSTRSARSTRRARPGQGRRSTSCSRATSRSRRSSSTARWNVVAANARHRDADRGRRAAPARAARSTRCGSRCTPTAWRRGSSTSAQWRAHLLRDLGRRSRRPATTELHALHDELSAYPGPEGEPGPARRVRAARSRARTA